MPKKLLSREEVPFAEAGENTFGLAIVKEVWEMDRREKTYWKYSLPNTVQIFALTTEGQIIAISEFQPGVGADYLHLPGETMEQGETPLEAATRGLVEETGYEAGPLKLLSSILENSGRSDRLVHIVLITDCKKSKEEAEKGIKTVLLPPSEFWNRLMQYFGTNPDCKNGGGNTLKATTLAFQALDLLRP
ncbi:MAG: hypothetical protein A3D92_04370 [Bacteroidetes bacterium RIFCSPHIGHO2_02_FULL_44_7]|nr:MAG: hypothetical protein A3D92_04370 [Bacteroidetes bacterium RIFCSPHIGHO2_02_FULL_44_7]